MVIAIATTHLFKRSKTPSKWLIKIPKELTSDKLRNANHFNQLYLLNSRN